MAGLAIFFGAGCATITRGRYQKVEVVSSPPGAKACASGQCVTTPGTLTLKRNSPHGVLIEKEGYVAETAKLTSGVGPAIIGSLIFGRVIGLGVDATSGAIYKLRPETINVSLKQIESPPQPIRADNTSNLAQEQTEQK